MSSRTELIGNSYITGNYYKTGAIKSEDARDFGALLQAGNGREEQLRAAREQVKDAQAVRRQTRGTQSPETEGKETEEKSEEPKSYREQILEKMAEMMENIRKGTIQPKFQIGAQEFTIEEWETFLEKFDAAEEVLREEVEAQIEELKKQAEVEADAAALLTDEVTKCSYPTDDPKHKHWYITAYGQDGISCKEAYFDGTRWINKDLWSFSYTEKGQYEKVMAFLQRFPQDANLRFAAHENFWKDFLAGEIDEDDFVAFFETTKDGVPDYTYEKDGSTYIDREKVKYAKYMNGFSAHFYTAEEMELIQRAVMNENRKSLRKLGLKS